MLDITYAGALLAGLVSFFTPCILPMVPFYLCYMAGLSMGELRGEGDMPPGVTRRLTLSAICFALGITTIFVLLGFGATAIGTLFAVWKDTLAYGAAALLAVFGLHFLGIVRIPLLCREARLDGTASPASFAGSYLMGLAFGFGWTPCVGPTLTAILILAGGMGSVWQGGALLFVYGVGMTAPFIVAAMFARPFLGWVGQNRALLSGAEKLMGGMLVLFAILILTGGVTVIADWMLTVFPGFADIG
ncbi:MAG: cytochrome c biogenesis protein CcdA [Pseudomonadota bacterium]